MSLIIVTGLARSGTSMMMGMLEAGGVNCVYIQVRDEYNPRGYYEHPNAIRGDFRHVPDGYAVKVAQMLPTLPPFDCRVVLMRREMTAIAGSMLRIRKRVPDRVELANQLDTCRLWCSQVPTLEVWYADVMRNTPLECLRISRFLQRDLDLAAMAKTVCPP